MWSLWENIFYLMIPNGHVFSHNQHPIRGGSLSAQPGWFWKMNARILLKYSYIIHTKKLILKISYLHTYCCNILMIIFHYSNSRNVRLICHHHHAASSPIFPALCSTSSISGLASLVAATTQDYLFERLVQDDHRSSMDIVDENHRLYFVTHGQLILLPSLTEAKAQLGCA